MPTIFLVDTTLATSLYPRRPGRRPNFPAEFNRQVVEATLQPGASVSIIAREHDVNANLVFRWRQQYQDGVFGPVSHAATLLPVQVIETPADVPPAVLPQIEPVSEIVIETGKVRLRIIGAPDPQTVQLVLQQLLR